MASQKPLTGTAYFFPSTRDAAIKSSFILEAYSGYTLRISSMDITLPASMKELASAPLNQNSTSGSDPIWKSLATRAFTVSSETAEESFTVFPVEASQSFTAFW